MCVRVCECVCERERECSAVSFVCVCVCVNVCVLVCERGRNGHTIAACVQTYMSFITVTVTRLCSPLGLKLMVKLKTLFTVFLYYNFES